MLISLWDGERKGRGREGRRVMHCGSGMEGGEMGVVASCYGNVDLVDLASVVQWPMHYRLCMLGIDTIQ